MNQSRSSLITSFFKSPAASQTDPVTNGARSLDKEGDPCDDEESRSSLGAGSEAGEGGGKFALNLNSLLHNSAVSQPLLNHHQPPITATRSGLENTATPVSTVSSGTRQGSLTWDTSSGTLSLRPAAASRLPSPPLSSVECVLSPSPPPTDPTASAGGTCEIGANGDIEVGVAAVGGGRRRSGRRLSRDVDYCEDLRDSSSSEEERGRKRKRIRRNITKKKREIHFVVSVERSVLHRVPGQVMEESGLWPESGNEVEVVESVEGDLDKSVVVLSSSPPPPPPPPPPSSSSTASLSGAWAKIFSRPVKQTSSSARPPVTRTDTEPTSPVRSPKKRVQRSASCSPRRLTRSPRAPRSPRHCSPLRSPHKGTSSTTASPLKSSLQPRLLIPPRSKRPRLEFDHAPFSNLVHVRQESVSEPFWTLTSAGTGLRPRAPPTSQDLSLHSCLSSCLSLQDVVREDHAPLLTPVTSAEQRASILERLVSEHPLEQVEQIYQKYRRIREVGGVDHTHLEAPPTSRVPRRKRSRQSSRQPLVCKIHILNGRRGRVKVDGRRYGEKPARKRSLRLSKRRSVSLTENSVGEGLTEGGERVKRKDGGTEREEARQNSSDMWTELYRPQSRSEVIGNKVKVQQLYSWLQSWSSKSTGQQLPGGGGGGGGGGGQERKESPEENRSSRESSPTPEWARGGRDFMSLSHLQRRQRRRRKRVSSSESEAEVEEGESGGEGERVSSVLLLCGGVGCGKTAAVHACAAELGCKVFEVNSSSIRSRLALISTLKEATLSHQVSLQPSVASHSTGERGVKVSTNQKKEKKKKKVGINGLLTFFKPAGEKKKEEEEREGGEAENGGNRSRLVSLESSTVILLEEVDVLFDSDRGFWSGVYDLIATTRRPFILTCNDSRYELDCHHTKIEFDPPPLEELGLHIQLLCLSCDYHMTSDMAVRLADSLHGDIRRVFLSLQFWISQFNSSTSHLSLHLLSGLSKRHNSFTTSTSSLLSSRLLLPWKTGRPHPLTSDLYRDIDMASHRAEQCSYVDVISMETNHTRSDDIIKRVWWKCEEEEVGLLDELPERETRWREEEVEEGVCEEVERGGGGSHHDPISWTKFTRHVQSVRECLEKCSKVFAPASNLVGVATSCLPLLRTICCTESTKRLSHTKRRFRHYLRQNVAVDQADLDTLPLATRFSTRHY